MRPASALGGEKYYKQQYDHLRVQHSKLLKEYEKLKSSEIDRPASNAKSNHDQVVQLATMKRKLEELERVHMEGKREHAKTVSDLKSQLDHHKRTSKDQSDQLARLKKQLDTSEHRLSELKKSSSSDASELKDLRYKLRVAEQNAEKIGVKQGEVAELRKAVSTEKVRAEKSEREVKDLRTKLEREEGGRRELERKLEDMAREARKVREDKESLQGGTVELEEKVEGLRSMVSTVTEQYSRLWSRCVPREEYDEKRNENVSLKLQVARLERKLGNAEDQVTELASLVRQCRSDKDSLDEHLVETQERLEWMTIFANQVLSEKDNYTDSNIGLSLVGLLISERQTSTHLHELQILLISIATGLLARYRHSLSDILLHHTATFHLLGIETTEHDRAVSSLSALHSTTTNLQTAHDTLVAKTSAQEQALEEMKRQLENEKASRTEVEKKVKGEVARLEGEVRREKEIAQKMQSGMQQAKMAEEALKEEIDQLSAELSEAEAYRQAYNSILAQVQSLVDRNALAEDEAERLSKMNVEFLSHNNPQQRIVYLDRVRRELAETKQKLLASTRDNNAALEEISTLRDELHMYKSVPLDGKPRTHITRVSRVPLASRSTNSTLNASLGYSAAKGVGMCASVGASRKTDLSVAHEHEDEGEYEESGLDLAGYLPDRTAGTVRDMTVDELM